MTAKVVQNSNTCNCMQNISSCWPVSKL